MNREFPVVACLFAHLAVRAWAGQTTEPLADSFCDGWQFVRAEEPAAASPSFDDSKWETVSLPHAARVEALVAGKENPQWQGTCWYRKSFNLPLDATNKTILLRFDGAMNA